MSVRGRFAVVCCVVLGGGVCCAGAETGVETSAGITEVRVNDGATTFVLRADGTAERFSRGRGAGEDRPAGLFLGQTGPREFESLARLVEAEGFFGQRDFMLPFPKGITQTTVVKDGRAVTRERHQAPTASEPEGPLPLWAVESAALGAAARVDWTPAKSGVRGTLEDAGEFSYSVVVRDPEYRVGPVILVTRKSEFVVPMPPGTYQIEIAASVGEGEFVEVSAKAPGVLKGVGE